ncbi:MAG: hypothetical protein E7422_07935 [Ruminococcaceae bacterium]|jgi:hypothetical protein|nr:hypothetical protein [Oscillospiraceae bacterium]
MKKYFAMLLAAIMLLALAGCGGKTDEGTASQQTAPAASSSAAAPAASSEPAPAASAESTPAPAEQSASGGIAPASNGTLTVSKADIAVVVNGTSVPMPYSLKALESAGVPADADRDGIQLNAGDFFSANLYLDENEDYLLIPAYYNGGDSAVSIMDAEAEEITMTTYADAPQDQGVSIFGVSFGMSRSEVKALLGEPSNDSGDYVEWHIEVPDIAYEGTLSMYFTEDSDSAGVSQVDLTVFSK